MPGTARKAKHAIVASTPAPIIVASTPIASAMGPAIANEIGVSPIETIQSRALTRASSSVGT